jgi:hypothetical protein
MLASLIPDLIWDCVLGVLLKERCVRWLQLAFEKWRTPMGVIWFLARSLMVYRGTLCRRLLSFVWTPTQEDRRIRRDFLVIGWAYSCRLPGGLSYLQDLYSWVLLCEIIWMNRDFTIKFELATKNRIKYFLVVFFLVSFLILFLAFPLIC